MNDNRVTLETKQQEMKERMKISRRDRATKEWRERVYLDLTSHELRLMYNSFASHAKMRGHCFTLTLNQFQDLMSRPCAYGTGRRPNIRIGLDRKDSKLGYTAENTVACCARHNRIKSDVFTYDEMVRVAVRFNGARECGNTTGGRKKTHVVGGMCSKGHPLTENNIYRHSGSNRIVCATCSCERSTTWSKAKHAERRTQRKTVASKLFEPILIHE